MQVFERHRMTEISKYTRRVSFCSSRVHTTETRTYLLVTKNPSDVLERDPLTGNQAMLDANRDLSPDEGLPPEVRHSEDIIHLNHDPMNRVLLRDKSYRTFSRTYRFVHI